MNRTYVIHVAPDGSDRHPGTRLRPVASPARAVRLSRRREAGRACRIVIAPGTYAGVHITLSGRDSNLTITGASGMPPPRLLGGVALGGWVREDERLWRAPLPIGVADTRMLVVNGRMCPQARLPERGRFRHESTFDVRWLSASEGGWERAPTAAELTSLHYRPDDLGYWLDVANAEVTVFHQWDESRVPVRAIEPRTRTLHLAGPCGHPPGAFQLSHNTKAQAYIVWNTRHGMHRPGQWYCDRERRCILYWPLPDEQPECCEALVPDGEFIFRVQGSPAAPVRDLTLQDLQLSITGTPAAYGGFGAGYFEGAVSLTGASEGLRLQRLEIRNVAGWGIARSLRRPDWPYPPRKRRRLREHACATDLQVSDCTVTDTGAGGIAISGINCRVARCRIARVGRLYPSAIALTSSGTGIAVIGNHISDTPYSAITGRGTDCRYIGNRIETFMTTMDDGGAIYIFGGRRILIRHNLCRGSQGHWSSAYYLDERTRDSRVERNIAIDTAIPCHNHMAGNNRVRGNLFVDQGAAELTFVRCDGYGLDGNIVMAGQDLFVDNPDAVTAWRRAVFFSRHGTVYGRPVTPGGYERLAPVPLARPGVRILDPGVRLDEAGRLSLVPGGYAAGAGFGRLLSAIPGAEEAQAPASND